LRGGNALGAVPGMTVTDVFQPAELVDPVRLAAAAYLARYKGWSRIHNDGDLRCWLRWCHDRDLPPLTVQRVHVELFIRWLQEVQHLKPATVARRTSVVGGFYRTCVIDGVLEHSPAQYVRRPTVPAESPTLGLTHLQFEGLLAASRTSTNPYAFALVCLLDLLGLRVFEATGANICDLGDEHGHRVLRVHGKGGKIVLASLLPAVARAVERAAGERTDGPLLLNRAGRRMDRQAATRRLHQLARTACVRTDRMHPHMLRHTYVTSIDAASGPPPGRSSPLAG
jgi:integrase/recombinase XerD